MEDDEPFQVSQLVESIRKATEVLVWGEYHNDNLFNLFCEHHLLADFINALRAPSTCHDVKVQLLQSLGILVQNARRTTSTFYLLSGGLLNSLFDEPPDLGNEEILAYYVALLKGLALQLDDQSCQLCLAADNSAAKQRMPLLSGQCTWQSTRIRWYEQLAALPC